MKNRTVIGAICIIAALIISFGIAPLTNRVLDSKKDIVRMKADVLKGQLIKAEDVEMVSVGAYHLPDNIITNANAVVGYYAATDLCAGDYLMPRKLKLSGNTASDVLGTLTGEQQAVSISVASFAGGLSGKLENGDIISVIVYSEHMTFTPPELRYVRVITTTTAEGFDNDELEEKKTPATVTLLVSKEQAELLTEYENSAVIHLSLVYRGNNEEAEKFLSVQEEYLQSIVKKTAVQNSKAVSADE